MNKNNKIENSGKITDWMLNADLIPFDNNFDKLLKGFIETPGRMVQPSYNFYVSYYRKLFIIYCTISLFVFI